MNVLKLIKQQPLWKKASYLYAGLGSRDQYLVRLLLLFMTFIILWQFMIQPSYQYAKQAEAQYIEKKESLLWMRAQAKRIQSDDDKRVAVESIIGTANTLAEPFGIQFKRFEPFGEKGMSLWIEGITFNSLIKWLDSMTSRYLLEVKEISIDRQSEDGLVNVRLVLEQ